MAADATFDPRQRRALLEGIYRAFNERDIDAIMEHLAPGVDWADAATGGRIDGRDALRAYWQKQWRETNPRLEPMRIKVDASGKSHVVVDQLIRSLDGKVLQNKQVEHVYEFEGPFISRMTIVELAEGEIDHDEGDWDHDGIDDGHDGGGEGGPGGDGGSSGGPGGPGGEQ